MSAAEEQERGGDDLEGLRLAALLREADEPGGQLTRGGQEATFAFGDLERSVFGLVRVHLQPGRRRGRRGGEDEPASMTTLALIATDARVLHRRVDQQSLPSSTDTWAAATQATAAHVQTVELGAQWSLGLAGEGEGRPGHGEGALELQFQAAGPPAVLARAGAVGPAVGEGQVEQPCTVHGHIVVDGQRVEIQCLGQRGRVWCTSPPRRPIETREVDAWVDDELSITLRADRPAGARGHDADEICAAVITTDPPRAVHIGEPRLSTAYDAAGRPQRAGMELWPHEDSNYPHRLAGEVLVAADLPTPSGRLHCAFLRWRMDGREGAGRYELRRPDVT
jgi:hypothetical protein